jgi:hypothetical protein
LVSDGQWWSVEEQQERAVEKNAADGDADDVVDYVSHGVS